MKRINVRWEIQWEHNLEVSKDPLPILGLWREFIDGLSDIGDAEV